MKKLFIIFLFILPTIAVSQPGIKWQKGFGGSKSDTGFSIERSYTDGFIAIGSTRSDDKDVLSNRHGTTYPDVWIIEVDTAGNLLKEVSLGGTSSETGYEIIQYPGKNYLFLGATASTDGDIDDPPPGNGSFSYLWVGKLNNELNLLWNKTYGNFQMWVAGIDVAPDKGFVAMGSSRGGGGDISRCYCDINFYRDIWVVRTDSLGNIMWERSLGGMQEDTGAAIRTLDNGHFLGLGTTESTGHDVSESLGESDIWIFELDDEGNIVWEKSLGGSTIDEAKDFIITSNNEIVVIGSTWDKNDPGPDWYGNHDYYIAKLSLGGELIWEKKLGGSSNDLPYKIIETIEGELVIMGHTLSDDGDVPTGPDGRAPNMWLVSLDQEGNILWHQTLGGRNDSGRGLVQGSNNELALVGITYESFEESEPKGNGDLYLAKFGGNVVAEYKYLTLCQGDSLLIDNRYVKESGLYKEVLYEGYYSDSIRITEIDIQHLDVFYEAKEDKLFFSSESEADVFLVNCADGTQVVLQDSPYTFLEDGDYSLLLQKNGCSYTSECFSYTSPKCSTDDIDISYEISEDRLFFNKEEGTEVFLVHCDDDTKIALNQSYYTFQADGSYSLLFQKGSCSYSTDCFTYTSTKCTAPELEFYPNPAANTINIQAVCEDYSITIFDTLGKRVKHLNIIKNIEGYLDVRDLTAGTYLMIISNKVTGIVNAKKIVIVN